MSKPNNTINKLKFNQAGQSITKEIVPHRLTDGTNLVELPTITKDKYVVVSDAAISVPSTPTTSGDYTLVATVVNGQVVFGWVAVSYEYSKFITSNSEDFNSYDTETKSNVEFDVVGGI